MNICGYVATDSPWISVDMVPQTVDGYLATDSPWTDSPWISVVTMLQSCVDCLWQHLGICGYYVATDSS